jgi:hypothetical protein
MKKTGIIFLLLFLISGAGAQVKLEYTYQYSATTVKLETHGYKYYIMDVPNAQCRIYNLDHSIFRTIYCSVPGNSFLTDVKFVSERLFDTDPEIELAYTWYRYVASAVTPYYVYGSSIINEDGSLIAGINGARYLYMNEAGDNEWKLFAYCYDYSVWPEKIWTNIYSLPGSPLVSATLYQTSGDISVKAFPNPADNRIKAAYRLPAGASEGILYFFNSDGKLMNQFRVDKHTDHLLLDVSMYRSGLYHYFVESGNKRSSSEKMVIR